MRYNGHVPGIFSNHFLIFNLSTLEGRTKSLGLFYGYALQRGEEKKDRPGDTLKIVKRAEILCGCETTGSYFLKKTLK